MVVEGCGGGRRRGVSQQHFNRAEEMASPWIEKTCSRRRTATLNPADCCEVKMDERRNTKARETEVPRENPSAKQRSSRSPNLKVRVTLPGMEPVSPWLKASSLAATSPWPQLKLGNFTRRLVKPLRGAEICTTDLLSISGYGRCGKTEGREGRRGKLTPTLTDPLSFVFETFLPPKCPLSLPWEELELFTSHQGEPGSIPGRVTPGFSQAGIVPDDAAGRQVFSGISHPLLHSSAAPLSPHLIVIGSQDLLLYN
ncbi:hypothetical protein PR048_028143 [Dryococelus australis]|uniref:Uncharacterized protein n=1 Tax=Dryococelus australis TaxID=614101 RepID=A0ABQ9GIE9_9NEOP|nr:hypothetical protein PR048_028143 [Dryococelus australis]